MAAQNRTPKQERTQASPTPTGRHAEDYRRVKDHYLREAEAATNQPGKHRTPSGSGA